MPVDGFVRVADLDPAFQAPFGNQCDMMYLSTALKAGPHLRTVLAHEYMHAVVFSQQVAEQAPAGGPVPGRRRMARRGDRPSGRGSQRVFDVEHRLSRQRVPVAARALPARGGRLLRGRPVPQPRQSGEHLSVPAMVRRPVWPGPAARAGAAPAGVESPISKRRRARPSPSLFRRLVAGAVLSGLEVDAGADRDCQRSSASRRESPSPREEWELAGPRCERLSRGWLARSVDGGGHHQSLRDRRGLANGCRRDRGGGPPEAELQVTALPLGDRPGPA